MLGIKGLYAAVKNYRIEEFKIFLANICKWCKHQVETLESLSGDSGESCGPSKISVRAMDSLVRGPLGVEALPHVVNPLTQIVHFWTTPRTRPLSLAHKQRIGVCPIALKSAVFKELHHFCSMGIGHSQQELHSVKEAIQSCMH